VRKDLALSSKKSVNDVRDAEESGNLTQWMKYRAYDGCSSQAGIRRGLSGY
jgi:hypothetical protein